MDEVKKMRINSRQKNSVVLKRRCYDRNRTTNEWIDLDDNEIFFDSYGKLFFNFVGFVNYMIIKLCIKSHII